jgi:C4-dicarboxylate-specific signal transduction histidine kinase
MAFSLVLFATLVAVLGLNIALNQVEKSHEKNVRFLTEVVDAKSEILLLDETLTDRAIRFVLTREPRYHARYRMAAGKLDDILKRLRSHDIKSIRESAESVTESNEKLLKIEESAIAEAQQGRADFGYDLLNSEKYRALKKEYLDGALGLADYIDEDIKNRVESNLKKRNLRTIAVTIVMVALIGFWIWFLSLFADWKRKIEELNLELDQRVEDRTKELDDERHLRLMNAKLAAVGELAANIAHEVNNPLQIIALRAQQVIDIADDTESKTLLKLGDSLMKTTKRLTKIANGLRSLSRDGTSESVTRVDLEKFLADIVEVFEPRFKSQNISFEMIDNAKNAVAYFRPTQISQVLMNLINNAIDAVAGAEAKHIVLGANLGINGVEFFVRDSGKGVPPENVERIMEPFFTTKPFGEGTGLGLSISKELVNNHRGKITYARKNNFTEFKVFLPQDAQVQRVSPSRGKVVTS